MTKPELSTQALELKQKITELLESFGVKPRDSRINRVIALLEYFQSVQRQEKK